MSSPRSGRLARPSHSSCSSLNESMVTAGRALIAKDPEPAHRGGTAGVLASGVR